MKKTLMIAAAAAAVLSADASAFTTGFYTGATVGYTHNSAKLEAKDATAAHYIKHAGATQAITKSFNNGNGGGFNGGLFGGYNKMFNENMLFDVRFFASFDTATVKLLDITAVHNSRAKATTKYRPQFGLGLGAFVGRMFNDKIAGYVGLVGEFNFAKLKTEGTVTLTNTKISHSDNITVFSLTPTLAVKGKLNDKMAWLAEVGYKFAVNTSSINKDLNMKFAKKPKAFVAKVGVSYHF